MSLVAIGVNHRTAPLAMLEKFAVDSERTEKVLHALVECDNITEAVMLSTCHRTEIWVVAERFHGAFGDVRDVLSDVTFLAPDLFADHLSAEYDVDAVRHLFEVSAGLDSVVVGEHEILGQVANAWEAARTAGAAGPQLNLLFRHAVEVGKRARTETGIARGVTSVSQAAVVMAAETLSMDSASVLVVGAGEMGRGMLTVLADHGVDAPVVANRTFERAEALAAEFAGRPAAWDSLVAEVAAADVVFTSTGASEPVLTPSLVAAAMADRDRPLVMVDIAVPRDVDPAVASIDGVTVLDMEALSAFAERGLDERRREVPKVRDIVDAELVRFESARSSREVAPLVADLHSWAETLRQGELERFRSKLAELDPEAHALVEALSRGLVAKLLHHPTVSVKGAAGSARGDRLAASLRELFDL